jgi:hypothetical protein
VKPKSLLWLWIAAFSLKAMGASWDASFHFKYLRETTQSSHIMNAIGLGLACFLWLYMAHKVEYKLTKPLKVSGLGFLIFFVGIPLDEAWHRMFGIDLTTWSLTHAILYSGTALMIAGMILQVESDFVDRAISKTFRTMCLIILMVFVLESFWFPLLQQEQGVISLYLFEQGTPLASQEIIVLLNNPRSQIYGGIPDWLYGVYACFASMIVFRITKYYKLGLFSFTAVAFIYVLFRVGANLIYDAVQYPQSTVPYYLLFVAIAADLLYRFFHNKRIGWFAITICIVGIIYSVSLINPVYPFHPPMPLNSALAAFFATMLGYGVASFLLHQQEHFTTGKDLVKTELFT